MAYILATFYPTLLNLSSVRVLLFLPCCLYTLFALAVLCQTDTSLFSGPWALVLPPLFPALALVFAVYATAFLLTLVRMFRRNTPALLAGICTVLFTGASFIAQALTPTLMLIPVMTTVLMLLAYLFVQHQKLFLDPLTALPNRQALRRSIDRFAFAGNKGHIVLLSLSGFKFFNQHFGQQRGDEMLQTIADFLRSLPYKPEVYRYGDDKFAVLLAASGSDELRAVTERIISRFHDTWHVNNTHYIQTCVVATVGYPLREGMDMDIFNAMDFALYDAKRHNINKVYDDGALLMSARRKHDVFQALKRALAGNTFEIYYQPIYNLKNERFESAEALLRLYDPQMGHIPPGEFVPIAEEHGLILDMTLNITRKVSQFLAATSIPDYFGSVSINLSAVQLMQEGIAEELIAIIEQSSLPLNHVRFELTETVLAESFEKMKNAMNLMAERGISFALDDYGTGYSNLSYLLALPFSTVKIDRSIVVSATKDATLADCVITMVHKLGKRAVAEGVETREVSDIMRALSCDDIQGYFYSLPLTQEAFGVLLRGNAFILQA